MNKRRTARRGRQYRLSSWTRLSPPACKPPSTSCEKNVVKIQKNLSDKNEATFEYFNQWNGSRTLCYASGFRKATYRSGPGSGEPTLGLQISVADPDPRTGIVAPDAHSSQKPDPDPHQSKFMEL